MKTKAEMNAKWKLAIKERAEDRAFEKRPPLPAWALALLRSDHPPRAKLDSSKALPFK